MRDILLPRTDGGVAFQAAIVFPLFGLAIVASHRWRDLQLLVIGLALCTAGLFGVRALH